MVGSIFGPQQTLFVHLYTSHLTVMLPQIQPIPVSISPMAVKQPYSLYDCSLPKVTFSQRLRTHGICSLALLFMLLPQLLTN